MVLDPLRKISIVASDPRTANDCDAMFGRITMTLEALNTFMDFVTSIPDEDEKDEAKLTKLFSGPLEKLTLRLMQAYPSPAQFDADVESLRGMRRAVKQADIDPNRGAPPGSKRKFTARDITGGGRK